ncbi:TadE/TadG family type IV pilus assembly protein [Promicromonospora sp. NPDC050880]|uniref:TadE/TadG family type IV pilus assembly protein n=1 Tax=Promicromonospora sp. NPDC050880 TaxID=3364406 RepID=UPI0037A2F524
MRRQQDPGERGQAAVELVGVVFVVVLVALLAVQGIAVAQTASITQEAARNGARALSQGRDWEAVVRRQVPDGLDLRTVRGEVDRGSASVRVTVSAPLGLAGLELTHVSVTRTAAFPVQQPRRTGD